jgi:pimeloyl-ACP methyl ester carboxylesterase
MQLSRYCTAALATVSVCATLIAQTPTSPQPVPGDASFTIFQRGAQVGQEQIRLARAGSQWIISSTGRIGGMVINQFEVKYSADWHPAELRFEVTPSAKEPAKKTLLATSFAVTSAINEITQNGTTNSKTDQISARTIVLPNNSFAPYEAMAARLTTAQAGADLPVYVAPQAEVRAIVNGVSEESIQTPAGVVRTKKYDVSVQNPGTAIALTVMVDEQSRLARVDIPAAGLSAVRNDLAGVGARALTARNPTDADVTIPANGFSIAGTITKPQEVGRLRHPTVVLVAGSGAVDRDSVVAGIPILSQLAGALAQQGFLALRYDKRGIGQTGGRTESATHKDYSEDLIAVVRWLAKRDDVDTRRLTVVGHSEGGAMAMLAAANEKKITSLVLLSTPATSGAELVLEQQRQALEQTKLTDAQKAEKVALQKQIHDAVVSGKGWEALPEEVRKQADTPFFRSMLLLDPAQIMARIKQPILIVQGDLDTQVPPAHGDKLADLARARKKGAGPVEVVHIPGVNHLLVPATTGEVQEYAKLETRTITPKLATTIVEWLKK